MGRAPCCDKAKVKRGAWSPEEDAALKRYLQTHGSPGNWIALPHKAGLKRCGKSCRLRWLNYLRPDIKHGGFTEEEDKIIFTLYGQMGSRWSVIASHLPGRTDNDVKNYWNTKLKKKLFGCQRSSQDTIINTKPSANYINYPNPAIADPCSPSDQTSFCLTFWDPLTQTSMTLPMLSDIQDLACDPFVNTSQSLNLDIHEHISLPAITDVSELGATLVNNQIVSPSKEGSSISDSSSVVMDNTGTTMSLPRSASAGLEDICYNSCDINGFRTQF